jgi:hypothetical protein
VEDLKTPNPSGLDEKRLGVKDLKNVNKRDYHKNGNRTCSDASRPFDRCVGHVRDPLEMAPRLDNRHHLSPFGRRAVLYEPGQ